MMLLWVLIGIALKAAGGTRVSNAYVEMTGVVVSSKRAI